MPCLSRGHANSSKPACAFGRRITPVRDSRSLCRGREHRSTSSPPPRWLSFSSRLKDVCFPRNFTCTARSDLRWSGWWSWWCSPRPSSTYLAGLLPSSSTMFVFTPCDPRPCPSSGCLVEVSRKSCSAFLGDAPWATKPHPNTSAWPTLKTALFVVQSPGDRLKSCRSRQGEVPPFRGTILIGPVESIFIASASRVLPASWGTSQPCAERMANPQVQWRRC